MPAFEERLAQVLAAAQARTSREAQINTYISRTLAKANSLLKQHGKPTKEPGLEAIEPIPLELPDGARINVRLTGYRPAHGDNFTTVDCVVTDTMDEHATPLTLFSLDYMSATWWDNKPMGLQDTQFMAEMVGHVYENTFVTAEE